jgi:beta-lactamase superfamily II metal-dependent hydrolase
MGYEIEFLPVDAGEKSGDAIVFRFGNLHGPRHEQHIFVVDGGYSDDGERVVKHIRDTYRAHRVDVVVSTHPDGDHAGGLATVLEELSVGQLWMHQPWNRAADIRELVSDGRPTHNSVSDRLERALKAAKKLEEVADDKGIPIFEPFTGLTYGEFVTVVGPSEEFYHQLLADVVEDDMRRSAATSEGLVGRAWSAGVELVTKMLEAFTIESLTDDVETSPVNNSSAILMLNLDGKRMLLTADAGVVALDKAADSIEAMGYPLRQWDFVQVPHHGSRRNVGPTILNRLIGPKLREDVKKTVAFVSASKEGAPKHPSVRVTNAFRRRGAPVAATQGRHIWYRVNAPYRAGQPLDTIPFFTGELDDE